MLLNDLKQNQKKTLFFQLDDFVNKFETEGPGVEDDMDRGQKLMEMYAVEFEKLETTRVEMGKLRRKRANTFAGISRSVNCPRFFASLKALSFLFAQQR